MKNVTGYDLVKLMAGSRGTLGVLTEVSFKVLPCPRPRRRWCCEGLDDEAGLAAMRRRWVALRGLGRGALAGPAPSCGSRGWRDRSPIAPGAGALLGPWAGDVTLVEGAAVLRSGARCATCCPLRAAGRCLACRSPCRPRRRSGARAGRGALGLGRRAGLAAGAPGADLRGGGWGRGHATLVRGAGGRPFRPRRPEVAALTAGLRRGSTRAAS
jgi:glycolate oxidase FAD binding subunit